MKPAWRVIYIVVGIALILYPVALWESYSGIVKLLLVVLGALLLWKGIAGRMRTRRG